jgi:hypothetical protein
MKKPGRIAFIFSILILSILPVPGQNLPADQPVNPPAPRRNLDETFELNIPLRQVTRESFEAATAVSTDGESSLNLQIGVGIATGRIDFRLRNVQGRVRFRGTLDRIFEMLDTRRPLVPAPK